MLEENTNAAKRKRPWSPSELFKRLLWLFASPLFCCTPRIFFGWRAWLLRCFGANVGQHVHIYPSVRIAIPWNLVVGDWSTIGDRAEIYNLGKVEIGAHTTISQRGYLCAGTHDHRDPCFPLLKMPITIGDEVWVCADAFIGPGVKVGNKAIVGARAVVTKDVPSEKTVVGNPARII